MNDPKRRPLGPAAQKVRDAVLATYADNVPRDENLWALERPSTVAALRALVLELGTTTRGGTIILSGDAALAIAAELEGHHG